MPRVQVEGSPSHWESSERGISKGKVEFLAAPSLETLHQFECLTLFFVPRGGGLGEIGHLGSQRKFVFLYFGCSLERLKQPAGAGHRIEQPVVVSHF